MSVPALRPAARMRPVLLECLERQRGDYWGTALGLAIFAGWLRVGLGQDDYVTGVFLCALAGLIPALPHERRPVWDAAMPVDPARYALVHVVCGIVHAAILLAVAAGLHAALFADPGHPGWYPLALFAWGLTWHLLVSAAFLLPRHPAVSPVRLVVLLGAGVPVLLKAAVVDPAEFLAMPVLEVLARTALPLGFASAAAYLVLRFPARVPDPADPADPAAPGSPASRRVLVPSGPAAPGAPASNGDPARARVDRPAPPLVRLAGPARPAATVTVFRRHFALLGRLAIVPALTLLLLVLGVLILVAQGPDDSGEAGTVRYFVESAGLGDWCAWLAFSWTALVWLGERSTRRRWNDALPMGTAKRRILHLAAGAAWLLLFAAVAVAAPLGAAVAAGTLRSPADVPMWIWLGIPCRTLVLYLAATFVFFVTHVALRASPGVAAYVIVRVPDRTPLPLVLAGMALGIVALPYMVFMLGVDFLESRELVAARDTGSDAASALWLALSGAAAAGVIALSDRIHQLDRLPTLQEVRGFLHGRARSPSGPPPSGHPAR